MPNVDWKRAISIKGKTSFGTLPSLSLGFFNDTIDYRVSRDVSPTYYYKVANNGQITDYIPTNKLVLDGKNIIDIANTLEDNQFIDLILHNDNFIRFKKEGDRISIYAYYKNGSLFYVILSGLLLEKISTCYLFAFYSDESKCASVFPAFVMGSSPNSFTTRNNDEKDGYFVNNLCTKGSLHDMYNFFIGSLSDSTDPYEENPSDDDGGDGDHDNSSDNIDEPLLPSVSAVDTGFINIFTPNLSQLRSLASYMWSSAFYDNILKLWADPMDVILGLSLLPCAIPTDGQQEVKCGNVSTGILMNHASNQFLILDCGSMKLNEFWGAYLDYSPYTKINLFLPYIGIKTLNTDDVMNKNISVKYHIDIVSGSCVAYVIVDNCVMYQYNGNVITNLPVTGENFSRLIQTGISLGANAIGTIATGGLSAPLTGMAIAQGSQAMANTANNVISSKPQIEKSGSLTGTNGLLSVQYPYLIIERPRDCVPSKQNKYTGYPSFTTKKLKNVSGYTQMYKVFLNKITCTKEEIEEIERLLESGVIL